MAENLANVSLDFFSKKLIRFESIPGVTKSVKDRICIIFVTSFRGGSRKFRKGVPFPLASDINTTKSQRKRGGRGHFGPPLHRLSFSVISGSIFLLFSYESSREP